MKKYFQISILVIMCTSCNSQTRVDLEQVNFKDRVDQLFANIQTFRDKSYPGTSLPYIYTYELNHFKYGPIELIKSVDDNVLTEAGIITNDKRDIVGLVINVGYTKQSLQFLQYLKSKYKIPIILAEVPKKNLEGQILGYANYLWNDSIQNRSILLSLSYEILNGASNISSTLYIIDNDVKSTNSSDSRTVKDLLIQSYTFKD